MSDNDKEFYAALDEIYSKIRDIKIEVQHGAMTAEQAGEQLRQLSIDLGTVSCMPFRRR